MLRMDLITPLFSIIYKDVKNQSVAFLLSSLSMLVTKCLSPLPEKVSHPMLTASTGFYFYDYVLNFS